MSSHREAPEISKDPAADNTDVYAFVDQTDTSMVNLIANFNPFEIPYGGPNFSEFADDVLYTINVSNAGASNADISYQFRFTTTIRNKATFLYNTGPLKTNTDAAFNRPQTYSVTKVVRDSKGNLTSTVLGTGLVVPPCNVGERSTPNYEATFGGPAVHALGTGRKVFAGQRSDAFYVDLGSVFDLAGLRPLNEAHLIPLATAAGVDGLLGLNVHTLALQVPISELAFGGVKPTDKTSSKSVIGVWASTYRSRGRMFDSTSATYKPFGDQVQISRLGNPLVNEVVNPMSVKDQWNSKPPSGDSAFAQYVDKSELAGLLPVLYPAKNGNPSPFANLAAYTKPRADLDAILLTGIPPTVLAPLYPGPATFGTYTGTVKADMLRLNLAVPPTAKGKENVLGVVVGDAAGFPNGRRVIDDVTSIELLAIAGYTIPFVDPNYTRDAIVQNAMVMDGSRSTANQAKNIPLLSIFPYLAPPASGYATLPPTPAVGGNPTAGD